MAKPRGRWVAKEREFRVIAARRGYRTQSQIAVAARVNQPRLSSILGGARAGDVVADRLASALGVKKSKIFREVEDQPPSIMQLDLELDESAETEPPADPSEAPSSSIKSDRCA